ncbi:unnamed protein product [Effrenium voratum]|nr:unnamed protein product [Effrenium voratum]
MQQCVNLQLDSGHNHEVGDTDAYREVVADFAQKLWQGITAWVSLEPGEYQQGILHRVNQEDEHLVTYDFQYSKQVQEGGKSVSKSFIVKDRPRHQIKTRQLLVKGDPAGGKTTFAKQLLTWIMRTEDAKWLVPVMVRTIDLVRSHEQFADDGRDMVDQYLGMLYRDTGHWELLELARLHGRLLVILDGFDEAGHLERQLGREISSKLNNEVFLIVTSREMSGVLSGSDFARFRSVRVKELNEDQRRQVIRRRLTDASHGEEAVQAFCNQLTLNPALCAMTRNPLLLNVTLSVYQTADGTLGGSLNRGKVYGLALDGMLSNLERAKAVGGSPVTSNLRKVLKSTAFLAHSERSGRGIRDFRRPLVQRAIASCGLKDWDAQWNEVEDLIKKGRLPLLTWFSEEGEDTFRFAHLTFQEFLCAEYCLNECQKSEDFLLELRELICPEKPQQIVERGWWQQSIQMFCDLAAATEAPESRHSSGKCWGSVLGECLLQLRPADALPATSASRQAPRSAGRGRTRRRGQALPSDSESERDEDMASASAPSTVDFQCHGWQVSNLRFLCLNQNYIGPEGCSAIAAFLRRTECLETLELVSNILCQGAPKEVMPPRSRRNPPTGYYEAYVQDLQGLKELLDTIRDHSTMRILDVRGNFLPLEAGRMLADLVFANPKLSQVCGVDLEAIRGMGMRELDISNHENFFNSERVSRVQEYHARRDEPFLSTGGAYFVVQLLLKHRPKQLKKLRLANQALASDTAGVVELYDQLGLALAGSPLETLDLSGFWDSGAEAGIALGRRLKESPVKKLSVGTGVLDMTKLRQGEEGSTLQLGSSRMRDCGAGIVSQCLPKGVVLDLKGAGLGAHGYKVLSQCEAVVKIDGVDLSDFQEDAETLDFSQDPQNSTGSVAAIIARTVLTPKLRSLNLSGSNLTSKSHVHPLTPVVGGYGGIGCNGGCDCRHFQGTNAYTHCAECDLDFCSTCCMSECPMIALAESLERLPHLMSLKLADVCFQGGRMGPVRSHLDIEGYEVLGKALSAHRSITELDLSKNYFQGQGFPHLLQGVVEMTALQSIALGERALDFRSFLSEEHLEAAEDFLAVEVQLLCMAIRRNPNLRSLNLNKVQLKLDTVRHLVHSLRSREGSSLDLLHLPGVPLLLRQLEAGEIQALDCGCSSWTQRSAFAPAFVFALERSRGLKSLDFSNNDFGSETEHVVDAVLALERGGLVQYNRLNLSAPHAEFHCQDQPVMPHGICVLAATCLTRTPLSSLTLQSCGLDARALQAVLSSLLQLQSVVMLDISRQPLKKAGVEQLSHFLRQDKKLKTLRAQEIQMPSSYVAEMLDFAKAMEVNSTLATLDLRGNPLHQAICARLRRTMEEKRHTVPLPLESKLAFLLCNRRLPHHMQLPEVAQVCEVSRLYIGGAYSPLFMIFQFCGQQRKLLVQEAQESPDEMWRPWHGQQQIHHIRQALQIHGARRITIYHDSDEEDGHDHLQEMRGWSSDELEVVE